MVAELFNALNEFFFAPFAICFGGYKTLKLGEKSVLSPQSSNLSQSHSVDNVSPMCVSGRDIEIGAVFSGVFKLS